MTKKGFSIIISVSVIAGAMLSGCFFNNLGQAGGNSGIQAYFTTPGDHANAPDNCSNSSLVCALVQQLKQAQVSVDVAMFTMNSSNIDTWGEAARKLLLQTLYDLPVNVRIRLDSADSGIKDFFETKVAICSGHPSKKGADATMSDGGKMHNKFIVIDGQVLITGSLNWNASSLEDNNENIVVIRDPNIAQAYETEFNRMWESKKC